MATNIESDITTYDHIILGSGQATGTLLGKLIPAGDTIAVIEGASVGGSCVNYGCTPTKTLVASARAMHQARRGEEFGFETGEVIVDYKRVRERMNAIRHGSRDGLADWMESSERVDLIRGFGAFLDNRTIRVDEAGKAVRSDRIYINTGARPVVPSIPGLDRTPWMDNAGLLDLEELPQHLVIIGGGYIGLEFAQVFSRFGSEVTVIQRGPRVMPREDPDVSEAIEEILREEGIRILTDADARETASAGDGVEVTVGIEGTDRPEAVRGSHLLLAVGRRPNSDRLNLEATDITVTDRGFIEVDDYCRTNAEGVYALGDVNGRGAFTHTSVNDAEIVLDHLLKTGFSRTISDRKTIYGLFIDPPLGRVGMTEKEALETGKRVLKATRPMNQISRAKEMSETKGFAKLLVDGDTDQILGASILGPGADEIINMFAAIMHSGIPCRSYREVVLVHPTVSELMPWILDGLDEAEPEF